MYTKEILSELTKGIIEKRRLLDTNKGPDHRPKLGYSIDDILPTSFIHKFRPEDVLEVAFEQDLFISSCSVCYKDENRVPRYKANGYWMSVDRVYAERIEQRGNNISHGYCPRCAKEAHDEIEDMRKRASRE